jgi:hypothetical protein
MLDPGETFTIMQRRYNDQTFAMMRRIFKDPALHIDLLMTLTTAPVIERNGYFEPFPHENSRKPPRTAWRWIIAARHGLPHPDRALSGVTISDGLAARQGLFIEDMVACSLDLLRVTGRLLGLVDVIGTPFYPVDAAAPVRVFETPLSWLINRCEGVVLVGDDSQVQRWLRDCSPGLIVNTPEMGKALTLKMRRPIPPLPPVLVQRHD